MTFGVYFLVKTMQNFIRISQIWAIIKFCCQKCDVFKTKIVKFWSNLVKLKFNQVQFSKFEGRIWSNWSNLSNSIKFKFRIQFFKFEKPKFEQIRMNSSELTRAACIIQSLLVSNWISSLATFVAKGMPKCQICIFKPGFY